MRVFSRTPVEEDQKSVKGKIGARGVIRFLRLAASPEPELDRTKLRIGTALRREA